MHRLELRIPPLALVAVFAAAMVAASVWMPLVRVPVPGHRVIALLLVVAGLGVALAGVVAFRRARTTVNPMAPQRSTTVVCTGIYRLSRNPMYLGMALALLGVAAWGSSLAGYVLVPAFCAYLTRFQIVPEERALLERFGPEFADYMGRARRWI
jgi:protein-S-isoprenylcysteine O-methyltransferase Ste14